MKPQIPPIQRVRESSILVVGDVMLDRYWHGEVGRISPEAPVPIVSIQREENRLGGAANVAANIRSLGASVTLLSVVGQDAAAQSLRQLLRMHRINDELSEDPDMETVLKLRIIGRSQQMLRLDFEKDPNHEVLAGMHQRFADLLKQHEVVVFSDYGKGGLTHISQMIEKAGDHQKPVLIDPKGSDWARYAGATVITPNKIELTHVIGSWSSEAQLQEKAHMLRQKLNVQGLLVTRAEEGMTLFDADRAYSVPAQAREIADVTGAGDTVIATMAVMVACGLDLPTAMHWANRAAGLVVGKFGTACVTYEELYP